MVYYLYTAHAIVGIFNLVCMFRLSYIDDDDITVDDIFHLVVLAICSFIPVINLSISYILIKMYLDEHGNDVVIKGNRKQK